MINYTKICLFEVQLIFKSLKEYQDFFENHLLQKKSEFETSFENPLSSEYKLPENLVEEYESYLIIYKTYSHNFRALFLVQTFSLFEFELKKICELYNEFTKSGRFISKMSGDSDYLNIKEFITKDCDIPFKEFETEWTFLHTICKIRNRIIHHQSRVSRNDKKDWAVIAPYIKKNNKVIEFKEDIDKKFEKDSIVMNVKKGDLFYKDDYQFSFCILDRKLNDDLLKTAECFIKKILLDKFNFQQNEKLENNPNALD